VFDFYPILLSKGLVLDSVLHKFGMVARLTDEAWRLDEEADFVGWPLPLVPRLNLLVISF